MLEYQMTTIKPYCRVLEGNRCSQLYRQPALHSKRNSQYSLLNYHVCTNGQNDSLGEEG